MRANGEDAVGSGIPANSMARTIESLRNRKEIVVLSHARLKTVIGQTGRLTVSTAPADLPYFVRTGEKTFELKQFAADPLGITMQFTPQAVAGESDVIYISPLVISATTLDGASRYRAWIWKSGSRSSPRGSWRPQCGLSTGETRPDSCCRVLRGGNSS